MTGKLGPWLDQGQPKRNRLGEVGPVSWSQPEALLMGSESRLAPRKQPQEQECHS